MNFESKSQEALGLSEEQFRRAIEEAPIPTIMQTEDGQVLQLSRSWTELTGYELRDMPTFDNWVASAVFEGAESVRKQMQELFKGNKNSINIELTVRTHSKGIRNWSFNASSPGTLFDGRRFIIGMAADITERKKAEEALKASEQNYRSLYNAISGGVVVQNINGEIIEANKLAREILGLTIDEISGRTSSDPRWAAIHEDGTPFAGETHPAMVTLETGKPVTGVVMGVLNPNEKHYRWIVVNAEPMFNSKGELSSVATTFVEITKRKKAEEALKRSEEQAQRRAEELQTLMDIVPVGIWISNDPECRNIVGNYTANRFYEALEDENVSAGPASGGEQDTTRRFFRNGKELLPQELPMQEAARKNIEIKDIELEIVIPSGKKLIILGNARPLLNNSRKVRGCLGAFIDITERKKAEEALRKMNEDLDKRVQERTVELALERERLFNVLESIPVMVILLTSDHKVAFANRSFIKRFGEPNDRHCYDFCFGNKEPCSFCESYKVLETGKPHHWQVNPPDGSVIDAYDFPFTDIDGTKMVLEMDIDITEQKKLERSLKDAERLAAIGATAGMVGHDIRNPLQAITGEIYLVNDSLSELPDTPQKAEMRESMESITANVGYINKIVADLQDYARPLKPEYTMFNLTKLIGDTLKTITLPDNIKLSVEAELGQAIKSDQTYLRRSVTNLVNNAIQAMPNGGTLCVTCHAKEDKVAISISDTGVGIPEHVKVKLFTPMMTTKSKGQGLGLAVVKRLIEALNGCITFDSVEGKGTKFMIELPIKPATEKATTF